MLGQYAEKYLLAECEPARRQSAVDTMRHLATTAWKSNILPGDLEHRGACSRLLHPSEKQRNDDLEELIAELTSHSVKELENIFKTGLLKESDGAGIMNMMNSRQDYDFFKTRYGRIGL
jgi:hypothetical protein